MTEIDRLLLAADALFFGDEKGAHRDLPRALALMHQAAELGSAQAHQDLGELCLAGEGCLQDLDAALHHFEAAVALGSLEARVPLALALMDARRHEEGLAQWGHFLAEAQAPESGWTRRRVAMALACLLQLCAAEGWPLPYLAAFARHEAILRAHLRHTRRRLAAHGLEGGGQVGVQEACLDAALRADLAA